MNQSFLDYGIVLTEDLANQILRRYHAEQNPDAIQSDGDVDCLDGIEDAIDAIDEIFGNEDQFYTAGCMEGYVSAISDGSDDEIDRSVDEVIEFGTRFAMLRLSEGPTLFGTAPYANAATALQDIRSGTVGRYIPEDYPLQLVCVSGVYPD